jgi:hypothetical protein
LIPPEESWLTKWLLHEATEVYTYWSCYGQESHPRIKQIWERMLQFELGHLRFVRELFEAQERRDAAEVIPNQLPDPIRWTEHRAFVRETLRRELDLRASAADYVPATEEPRRSLERRERLNRDGSPSETVASGYVWRPGTELASRARDLAQTHQRSLQ